MSKKGNNVLHAISTLVLVLLAAGIYLRKRNNTWHWRMMISAFVVDVALVLYIEVKLHAVETVVAEISPFIWFHATVSTAVLALYLVMFALGRKLITGQNALLLTHRNVAFAFCFCRVTNYVTSFYV